MGERSTAAARLDRRGAWLLLTGSAVVWIVLALWLVPWE